MPIKDPVQQHIAGKNVAEDVNKGGTDLTAKDRSEILLQM